MLVTPETGEVQRHVRTFSTMTAGLLALADWLASFQIMVVAMESTGIYGRAVFNEARKRGAQFSWSLPST